MSAFKTTTEERVYAAIGALFLFPFSAGLMGAGGNAAIVGFVCFILACGCVGVVFDKTKKPWKHGGSTTTHQFYR